jgi:hypothetical protein
MANSVQRSDPLNVIELHAENSPVVYVHDVVAFDQGAEVVPLLQFFQPQVGTIHEKTRLCSDNITIIYPMF